MLLASADSDMPVHMLMRQKCKQRFAHREVLTNVGKDMGECVVSFYAYYGISCYNVPISS